jgi:hypothetical protein
LCIKVYFKTQLLTVVYKNDIFKHVGIQTILFFKYKNIFSIVPKLLANNIIKKKKIQIKDHHPNPAASNTIHKLEFPLNYL